ncbi:MAG: 50S ribosomal protein L5 [Candidatus Parcubacteria bacterium]|nr:MAG: 50S ribosomal protein L5 [Candidatus Parcubacteria bacterium]
MLSENFNNKIKFELKEELGLKNILSVPQPKLALVNIGIGKLITSNPDNKDKIIEEISNLLSKITGQKPKIVVAKKSVSGFRLRKGMPVALLVTLRKKRLFDFIERLLVYALPRYRDFKGIKQNNLDSRGYLNLGIKDISVFPEATYDRGKFNLGLQITIITNSKNKEHNIYLWKKLGFPIKI